ncbi:hypothetical protein [Methylobrevis pamukkalensis]
MDQNNFKSNRLNIIVGPDRRITGVECG